VSIAIEQFEKGFCWDFKIHITNSRFTTGNLSGSKFLTYLGINLLSTIAAGGTGYTFDESLTKVTLDIHVEKAITSVLETNSVLDLFIEWQYGATLEHSKKIIVKEDVTVR
jgi:hypothetical protein